MHVLNPLLVIAKKSKHQLHSTVAATGSSDNTIQSLIKLIYQIVLFDESKDHLDSKNST